MQKRHRIRNSAVMVVVLLVVATGIGCKPSSTGSQITLAENITVVSAPVTVARVKGLFQAEGLTCNTVPFASGRLALDALLGGKADFATVAETPIVLSAMQGQPVRVLCTFTASERNTKLLARKDRGIEKPADLRGKKIAVTFGSNGAYFFDVLLRDNGLAPADVQQINLGPPDMAAAITRGDVDAICTWEPHIWNAKKILGDSALELGNKPGRYVQTFNIVVRKEYAEQHTAALTAFLKALLKAESFISQSEGEAMRIVAKENNLPDADLKGIWSDYEFKVTLNKQFVESLTGQAEWAVRTKLAPAENHLPAVDQLLLPGPLKALKPAAVNLQ
jgi:ABC-type nitrate/sulfonate/bicarbonate transport system substrate-binding protein